MSDIQEIKTIKMKTMKNLKLEIINPSSQELNAVI